MMDQTLRRRFYSEEVQITSNIRSAAVHEALATIPREKFLPPGPWTIRGEGDFQAAPRQTPDADPRHVYHNVAVAIDAKRMLFNGAPGLLAMTIDALNLAPGNRVLHIGTGLGYYTAVMAECVGSTGRVFGIEVDPDLTADARQNLAPYPWVDVQTGDGTGPLPSPLDAILVNAGVTHPLPSWLDALAPGGRLIVPITATYPGSATIGKGPLMLLTRTDDPEKFSARVAGFVAIYSAIGLRDEAANTAIATTLQKAPFAPVKTFRRDAHENGAGCWIHTPFGCFSAM
jgi:protein-L-isoaspartate(D-aspartate) O-methyltransferase